MIEKWIKNEQSLKRYRRFKSVRRAVFSVWFFVALCFCTFFAEFIANDKPIVMSYKSEIYFPIFKFYHPDTFHQEGANITNYNQLKEKLDWSLWPLVPWSPFESNYALDSYPSPPSKANWFGTDDRGRDILSRLIYGLRYSLGFALFAWFFSYILGICLGALMGFFGGKIDLIGQRFIEVFQSLPAFLLLLTLVSIFGASFSLLLIFTVLFNWVHISLFMRAEFLKLRKREFVESCRSSGGSYVRQIFKHILPNGLVPIITFSPFSITGYIVSLAALDYLGFGLPPPTPSWGELFQQAEKHITVAWWLGLFPCLFLFITLVVFNLIGEGVREAFDPHKTIK